MEINKKRCKNQSNNNYNCTSNDLIIACIATFLLSCLALKLIFTLFVFQKGRMSFAGFFTFYFLISLFGQNYAQSSYDSGYDHGCDDADISKPSRQYLNQPGKGPLFHSDEFMEGYNDGYGDCYDPNIEDSNGNGLYEPNRDASQTPKSNNDVPNLRSIIEDAPILSGLILLFLIIMIVIAVKRNKSRKKPQERKGFSQSVRHNVLRKQNHKCAHCKRLLNVVDYDHKNGIRSDNNERNCQALCPNCHAIKTRREKSKR